MIRPQFLVIYCCICFFYSVSLNAQPVDIPDMNLRGAVREALNITDRPQIELTRDLLTRLTRLNAHDRGITSLTGLEFADSLEHLSISGNPISDLSPIASLMKLKGLHAGQCQIIDLQPLSHLPELEWINLHANKITSIEPLATLPSLKYLIINNNPIANHDLPFTNKLQEFIHDQVCDIAPSPIVPRLDNKSYPSIFAAWGTLEDKDYDLLWVSAGRLGLRFIDVGLQSHLLGDTDGVLEIRDMYATLNSRLVLLAEIRMFTYPVSWFPEDWPHWLRDGSGHRIIGDGRAQVNYAHPEVQEHIIQRALAVARCGVFDGIYIDHWREQEHLDARLNILRTIRERTRPEFVIIVNTNDRLSPHTAPYINGGHMENGLPGGTFVEASAHGIDPDLAVERFLLHMKNTLAWNETHMREPRLNCFESRYFGHEPPDSALNRRWMRAMTSMTLVYSDGYVLFSVPGGHDHIWYDFWDADLGQPVGEKGQLYHETEGLYIREFANGWAVYNHSGAPQAISLPDKAQGVASGWVGMTHVLPDQDGEMYLKVTVRNPADVNGDGVVNIIDLTIVAQAIGTDGAGGDVNGDGVVNVFDLVFVANQF